MDIASLLLRAFNFLLLAVRSLCSRCFELSSSSLNRRVYTTGQDGRLGLVLYGGVPKAGPNGSLNNRDPTIQPFSDKPWHY